MKRYKTFTFIILMFSLLWPTTAFAKEAFDDKVVVGGTYTLESDETHDGSLVVFGGAVTIEQGSTVNGDVVLIGGTVEIGGYVNGSVVGIGGAVRLNEDAYVNGDLFTLGASLRREEGARVYGQVINGIDVPSGITIPNAVDGGDFVPPIPPKTSTLIVNPNPVLEFIWFFFRIFLYAALAVIIMMFLPVHVERVSRAALTQPLITGGAGLLTLLLAPLALIVITITIILIPVTIIAVILLFVAWFIGWVALGLEVGRRFAKAVNIELAPAISAGVGTLSLFFVFGGLRELIPCIGLVPYGLIGLWGLGAVLMTRFGTQDYSSIDSKTPADSPGLLNDSDSESVIDGNDVEIDEELGPADNLKIQSEPQFDEEPPETDE
jgi:hypothetical protein